MVGSSPIYSLGGLALAKLQPASFYAFDLIYTPKFSIGQDVCLVLQQEDYPRIQCSLWEIGDRVHIGHTLEVLIQFVGFSDGTPIGMARMKALFLILGMPPPSSS